MTRPYWRIQKRDGSYRLIPKKRMAMTLEVRGVHWQLTRYDSHTLSVSHRQEFLDLKEAKAAGIVLAALLGDYTQ